MRLLHDTADVFSPRSDKIAVNHLLCSNELTMKVEVQCPLLVGCSTCMLTINQLFPFLFLFPMKRITSYYSSGTSAPIILLPARTPYLYPREAPLYPHCDPHSSTFMSCKWRNITAISLIHPLNGWGMYQILHTPFIINYIALFFLVAHQFSVHASMLPQINKV